MLPPAIDRKTFAGPPDDDTPDRPTVRRLGLTALTLAAAALCAWIASPLLAPLVWAAALAIVAQPLHVRVLARVGERPALAAGIVVGAVAVVLVVPLAWVVAQLLQEAGHAAEAVRNGEAERIWHDLLTRHPQLAAFVQWLGRRVDLKALYEQSLGSAGKLLQATVAGSIAAGAGWLITFFVLFFFVRDRERVLATVARLLPLTGSETRRLFAAVRDTTHATVWGTLAVSVVQGTLGGLVFWSLDLPAPVVWGAVMAIFSVLPMFGAAIVWMPVAGYLASQGQWQEAALLTGFGAIVIGLIDNLLYPLLVKDRMRLHAVPVFVAIIGGLVVFGTVGIVLGPLLLAAADVLLTVWRRRLDGDAVRRPVLQAGGSALDNDRRAPREPDRSAVAAVGE